MSILKVFGARCENCLGFGGRWEYLAGYLDDGTVAVMAAANCYFFFKNLTLSYFEYFDHQLDRAGMAVVEEKLRQSGHWPRVMRALEFATEQVGVPVNAEVRKKLTAREEKLQALQGRVELAKARGRRVTVWLRLVSGVVTYTYLSQKDETVLARGSLDPMLEKKFDLEAGFLKIKSTFSKYNVRTKWATGKTTERLAEGELTETIKNK